MKKRGIMYTFLALIAITVISLTSFIIINKDTTSNYQNTVNERILVMNDFINSFKQDAERAGFISGFRTLIAMEQYVADSGAFFGDADEAFKNIFYNGSFNDTNFSIMNASTFYFYELRVKNISRDIDLNFSTNVTDITMYHESPWILSVNITINYTLVDNKGLASWNDVVTVTSQVSIVDLRDPLYSVNTLGKLPNTVIISPYDIFVDDTSDQNDSTNLSLHLNNSYYIHSNLSPSFLQRFENDLSPHPSGIESLVNLQLLADQGVEIGTNTRSVVDYIYFNTSNSTNYCNIQNFVFSPDNWFIIDEDHMDTYQITGNLDNSLCS